jgi:hypothetical protein
MSPSSTSGSGTTYVWSLTLRDLLVLVFAADLVVLGKGLLRVPLHVPGHSGLIVVCVFVLARGLVDKNGAGTIMGLVAGFVATVLGYGHDGLLEWTKYASVGIALDASVLLVGGGLTNLGVGLVVGALANLAKLGSMIIVGVILGLPLTFLALGLGLAAVSHAVFGAAGGLLAAVVLRQLRRVPYFSGQAKEDPSPSIGGDPPGSHVERGGPL